MFYYAILNENNICIGLSSLAGEVVQENMIRLEEYNEDYLGRKFENGAWSEEKFEPESTAPITEFEKLQQKANEQEQAIMELTIALATMQGGNE